MGNNTSSVYSRLKNFIDEDNTYYIYNYKDGFFLLDFINFTEEDYIKINISEIIPITKNDTKNKVKIIHDKNTGKKYKGLTDDIIISIPNISIYPYTDLVYLSYLYSTKRRTGKFNESLITDISKKFGADGIYLMDASRGGKCNNSTLSGQLFISENKRFSTYYETLGYKNTDINYIVNKKKLQHLLNKIEKVKVKDIIKNIELFIDNKDDIYYITDDIAVFYYLNKYGNKNLNLLNYLNDLIKSGKCDIFNNLLKLSKFSSDNIYIETLHLIKSITFGYYIKYFKKH